MTGSINTTAVIITIAGSALVTYFLRLGGLLLSEKLPRSKRFKRVMATLPGTILVSLVVPEVVSVGFWGAIAALSTAICVWKTKNVFAAMLVGVVIVAASRQFGK